MWFEQRWCQIEKFSPLKESNLSCFRKEKPPAFYLYSEIALCSMKDKNSSLFVFRDRTFFNVLILFISPFDSHLFSNISAPEFQFHSVLSNTSHVCLTLRWLVAASLPLQMLQVLFKKFQYFQPWKVLFSNFVCFLVWSPPCTGQISYLDGLDWTGYLISLFLVDVSMNLPDSQSTLNTVLSTLFFVFPWKIRIQV